MFNAPIPGESLAREKGNAPWEQPPLHASVDKALAFYMDKIDEDEEVLEDILFVLDNDFPLDLFVETMLMNGEMLGIHTMDTSYLIGPVIHEYLLGLAEAADIKVREFQGKTQSEKQKSKLIKDLNVVLDKAGGGELINQTSQVLTEAVTSPASPASEPAAKKPGLISRRI